MLNIYVGNLPFSTTQDQLQELFGQYGAIHKISIIIDRETGRSRGFGFVEMPNPDEGQTAIEALNGKEYGGRFLTVNEAKPRPERSTYSRAPRGAGDRY